MSFHLDKIHLEDRGRLDGLAIIKDDVRMEGNGFLFPKHSPLKRSKNLGLPLSLPN